MKEHIADRAMRPLRGLFIALLWASVPVSLLSLGMMMRLAFDAWPLWGFLVATASIIAVMFGIASLSDNRQERQHRQSDWQ